MEKEEIEESNREQSPTTQTRSIKATKKVRMAGWGGGASEEKGGATVLPAGSGILSLVQMLMEQIKRE